ncbi:histidine kinase [Moritella sp. 24]|uniref:ATP-binding protein n=1 Tax=Moritella sp. 24 TaxID=2746230 RepID=UPI001BAD33C8|nr:ATP-binding protein [Moritella sp. 24]QUM76880.1 histidine kinase [Moritella sp. 24]
MITRFSLKTQLLLVASLMLLLPWAGCQSVSILETSLRESHSKLLDVQLNAAAQQIEQKLSQSHYASLNTSQGNYYAPLTDSKMLLDGFDGEESDWENIATPWFQLNNYNYDNTNNSSGNETLLRTEEPALTAVKFKLAANNKLLYIFIQTSALEPHYYNPMQPHQTADQLNIRSINNTGLISQWQINPQGSGRVEMHNISQDIRRDAGTWLWRDGHYNIEIAIPINLANNAIGFDLILNDQKENQHFKSKPSTTYERSLVREKSNLNQQFTDYIQPGLSLYLLNSQYWLIGQLNADLDDIQEDKSWLSNMLYNKLFTSNALPYWQEPTNLGRWLSPQQLEQTTWYQDSPINKQLHSKTITVNSQPYYFVAVQDSRKSLLSASEALNQLLILLFTIIGIIVSALFAFASLLSWRIVKMKQSYRAAIDNDGKIIAVPEASTLPDELGDLSRAMQQLTVNQGNYTDYLASLADKLSHELKTPIAVIRTSLENLELSNLDPEASKYLTRAMQGTNRLSQTLNALSEANKLEQSLEYAQFQTVPFEDMLEELTEAYRQIYNSHQFTLAYEKNVDYTINLAPELIVQLLDKLISNAVDYSPTKDAILFKLSKQGKQLQLTIENQGPHFSSQNVMQLFDSMVSIRQQSDTPHLGLGLHIVKLISDFHHAKITAKNLPGDKGVIFELLLPIEKRQ